MKYIITLLILMSLSACAPNINIVDKTTGLPAINYELTLQTPDPDNKLIASFFIVRNIQKSKYEYIPEYLDIFKEYSFSIKETSSIYMVLRILNPKGIYYSAIYRKTSNQYKLGTDDTIVDDTIYVGNEPDKTFTINCPVDKSNYKTDIAVFKDQYMVFSFGEFKYYMY